MGIAGKGANTFKVFRSSHVLFVLLLPPIYLRYIIYVLRAEFVSVIFKGEV